MDLSPAWLIIGAVVAVFIVGGLLFAFVADRRRNQEVAHDGERTAPDPADQHRPHDHPGA